MKGDWGGGRGEVESGGYAGVEERQFFRVGGVKPIRGGSGVELVREGKEEGERE